MAASVFQKLVSPAYHLAAGVIFLVLVYAAQPGSSLFSWHPILMSLGSVVLMGKAVVILNSSFDVGLFQSISRASSVAWHFYLQVGALATMLIGFAVIYLVKSQKDKPHFTSWHGLLGLIVIVGAAVGGMGGIVANNANKFRHLIPPAQIKWGHSLLGTTLFSLACITLALGVTSNWAMSNMSRLQRCLVGSLVLGMAAVVWDQARKGFLLRPFQKASAGSGQRQGGGGSQHSSPRAKSSKPKK